MKRKAIKRFCDICEMRRVFNKTKDNKMVCSRCGTKFIIIENRLEQEKIENRNI